MRMKRLSLILLAALGLVSCAADLEVNEREYHSKEYMFADFGKVKDIMTDVYGYLSPGFTAVGGTMTECATDDAVYANTPNTIKGFYDGSWSANNVMDDQWSRLYSGIRAANYLMENCPEDFPVAKYLEEYERDKAQLVNFPWEAKALRAWFHFELLKRYNRIVIADRSYTTAEVAALGQKDYAEAAEWIAGELQEAAAHLPATYSGTYYSEVGRVTRGFALAARSRVLLYAASPLNNPGGDREPWVMAAAAAKDMLDQNKADGQYLLVNDADNIESRGVIFAVRTGADNSFERANFPVGFEGGHSGVCPSLNLAEAYDKADGTPFDPEADADKLLDGAARDPRFAKTLLYNGASFKGETVETFRGGRNGLPQTEASPTSFYLRKYVQEQTSLSTGTVSSFPHIWPVLRLSEVYLNYAEALFEATGDPAFTGGLSGTTFDLSPVAAVNLVRAAYGMPGLDATLDADSFRARLHNERRVELAFEGHRFWDLRRWKEGPSTTQVWGLDITRAEDGTLTVGRTLVQNRNWDEKMYFYPISEVEMHKNKTLQQNTGW